MTREKALKMAKADLKCMERDSSGSDEMCNSHKCDECSLNYERGNVGEQKEWMRMAIKALEAEPFTDIEQRIFLAAMSKEEKVCKEVDEKYPDGEPYEDSLVSVCRSIERKVKKALWRQ